jgi:phage protein D
MAAPATYAPNFTVRIAGEPLPTAMRSAITAVRHQDGMSGADRVELTLANDRLQWLDHPLLQPDTPFELEIGYAPGPLKLVFVGEITGIESTFPAGGMPTLRVIAHDFLQRLTTGSKDRAFALSIPCIGKFPLPDPYVAMLVSGTNLLIPAVDPAGAAVSFLTLVLAYAIDPLEAKRSIRIQQGSDFDFLSGLARENGWEMYIDHAQNPRGYVLRFQFLIQEYSASTRLRWGQSLIDFTPRISTVGQVAAVATRIFISAIKLELVVVLGWDYDRAAFDLQIYPGLGDLDALLGAQKSRGTLRIDAIGPATAPKKILGELLPRLNNRLTGSGTTIGDPGIRAGSVIALDGLGEQFGGLYRVTSATHTIDSGGYRTAFEVRKEVWFKSIPLPKGAGGLLRVHGQTVGQRES